MTNEKVSLNELDDMRCRYRMTEKRIQELSEKKKNKTMTRAELFELDMCQGDIKRYEAWFKKVNAII